MFEMLFWGKKWDLLKRERQREVSKLASCANDSDVPFHVVLGK